MDGLRLLTVEDVAAELRVPRSTAYQYMRQMRRVVTGRHVRVTREAFDAWIAEHTEEPIPLRVPSPPQVYVAHPRRRTRAKTTARQAPPSVNRAAVGWTDRTPPSTAARRAVHWTEGVPMRAFTATALLAVIFGAGGCRAAAAGLAGFSNGYNAGRSQSTYTPSATPSQPSADGCTSDYECAYGSRCVKHQFESEGYCAQVTDQNGVPTYGPPNPSSVGPGAPDQCRFDTDCPVGWTCDKGTGLTGTCVQ